VSLTPLVARFAHPNILLRPTTHFPERHRRRFSPAENRAYASRGLPRQGGDQASPHSLSCLSEKQVAGLW